MNEKKFAASDEKKSGQNCGTKWGSADDFFKTDINDAQSEWEKIRKERERKKAKEFD
ncbi:MAG: hypothetical protein ACC608_06555 [Anaerofustis sp.]